MEGKNPENKKNTNRTGLYSVIIAALVFLFGDNIIGRVCPGPIEPTVATVSTEETVLSSAEYVCTVPYVIGYEQTEAISIIENAKLDADVEVSEENISDWYCVINQSIPAGTIVPIGTTVNLTLAPK